MEYDINIAKTLTNIEDETLLDFYIKSTLGRIEKVLHYTLSKGHKTELINGLDTTFL